jgi:hypothetical protein
MYTINKTMNTQEDLPECFYVFVDMNNMITNHNLHFTKSLLSSIIDGLSIPEILNGYLNGTIDYLPFIPNPNMTTHPMSMFQNNITSDYRTEYNCEIFRKYYFPLFPSRLSAIYAFGDYESCKKAMEMYHNHSSYDYWNLNSIRKFKLKENPFNRIVKVNMELVSWERAANRISSLDHNTEEQIWLAYWNGESNGSFELPTIHGRKKFEVDTLWEYLIEGILELVE